jgi:ACS family hexuronate transporter-like MFS transporter
MARKNHQQAYGARLRDTAGLWLPTLSMTLATVVSFIDRNTLAVLAPSVLRDMRLTAAEYGLAVSAFATTYVAGNLVWGHWLDRTGVFWVMAAAVALWSAASVAHAFASGLFGLVAARALLGFAEGATFPGALRTVVQTLPPAARSRGLAVAYSGGSVGALVAPLLVTPIALLWGWRAAFWVTGALGGAWLLTWLPQRRPDLTAPPVNRQPAERPGEGFHWADRRRWGFAGIYAMGALPVAFVLYAAPLFLDQRLGLSQAVLGRVLWIPPLAMEIGFFFWGWVVDRLTARGGPFPGRRLFFALALFSLPLALTARLGSPAVVLGALSIAMFFGSGFIITTLAYATNTFPAANAGILAGLASGSWSLLTAVTMPLFGRLFDGHCYDAAFAVAAMAPLVGFAAWWVLDISPHRRQVSARIA